MKYEIVINGVSIDLYPKTVVAQTLKSIDIGDLTTRKFNFTNTINVPSTKINDAVFGMSSNYLSDSAVPYSKLPAKINVSGIETVSDGIATISSTSDGDYAIYIISGSASFFSLIEDKKLSALSDFTYSSNAAGKSARRNSTSGLLYPVGYYGVDSSAQNVHTNVPYIYDVSILEAIISEAGYTGSGSIFTNPKFLKQVTGAFANQKGYADSFVDDRRVSVNKTIAQVGSVTNGGSNQRKQITFDTVKEGGLFPLGYWDATTSAYICNDPRAPVLPTNSFMFRVIYRLTIDITVTPGHTVDIGISSNQYSGGSFSTPISNVGSGTHSFDSIITNVPQIISVNGDALGPHGILNGPGINIFIQYNTSPGFVPIPFTVNSATLVIQPHQIPLSTSFVNDTSPFYTYYSGLLPDVEQKEFIRNIMMQYSLIPSEENGVISFTSIDEIINSRSSALDWTNKREKGNDGIEFTPLTYAQANRFLYTNRDENMTEGFGGGSFDIQNTNIVTTKDIFRSIFSGCIESVEDGLLVAYVPLFDGGTLDDSNIYNINPNYRNLLVRSKLASEPAVTYPDTLSYSDYLAVYFEDPNQTYSMSWQQFINDNYTQFISFLQKAKIITRNYKITEMDIASLNFNRLIFDADSYYLVLSVSNYVKSKSSTSVKLFKV